MLLRRDIPQAGRGSFERALPLWSIHFGWVTSFELLTSVTVLSRIFGLDDLMRAATAHPKGQTRWVSCPIVETIIRLRMTLLEFTCEGRVWFLQMQVLSVVLWWWLCFSWIYGSLFLDAGGLSVVFISRFRLFRIPGLNLRVLAQTMTCSVNDRGFWCWSSEPMPCDTQPTCHGFIILHHSMFIFKK